MLTVTINRKSWHYRLATFLDKDYEDPREDFCAYVRGFFKTIIGVSFIAVLLIVGIGGAGALLWSAGETLAWFVACLHERFYFEPITLPGFLGWSIFVGLTVERVKPEAAQMLADKNPEFVKAAWRGFHGKTCFRLRLVTGDDR